MRYVLPSFITAGVAGFCGIIWIDYLAATPVDAPTASTMTMLGISAIIVAWERRL